MTTRTKSQPKNWQAGAQRAGWRMVQLDDGEGLSLIIDHRGKTPKKLGGDWSDGGIPALSAKNIKNGRIINQDDIRFVDQKLYEKWMPKKLESEDILLTSEAPLGELYFLKDKKDYCLSQRLFALRTNRDVLSPRYLYYYLLSPNGQHELMQRISGTAAQGIRQAELRRVHIKAPANTDEQKRIAGVLAAFDEKIENNNRIIKTLEEMAQAIFKEWFIHFRFPGHEKTEFVDSPLGRIPKGWSSAPIGSICGVVGGGTPSTKVSEYWEGGGVRWATPTDMTALSGLFIDATDKEITEEGLKNSSATLLPEGTILLTSRATVGVMALAKKPVSTNQGFISLVCKFPGNLYMLNYLQRTRELIRSLATGSTFPEISRGVFKQIEVLVPESGIHEQFNSVVGPIYEGLYELQKENQKLVAMRDLLLPRLMSGEIRV